jgi:hypothetical protein
MPDKSTAEILLETASELGKTSKLLHSAEDTIKRLQDENSDLKHGCIYYEGIADRVPTASELDQNICVRNALGLAANYCLSPFHNHSVPGTVVALKELGLRLMAEHKKCCIGMNFAIHPDTLKLEAVTNAAKRIIPFLRLILEWRDCKGFTTTDMSNLEMNLDDLNNLINNKV